MSYVVALQYPEAEGKKQKKTKTPAAGSKQKVFHDHDQHDR